MHVIVSEVAGILPAFAFLLAGVPLAFLLDALGYFDALAALALRRKPSLLKLWLLAGVVTAVLNLDATIVLLTPLYLRIAQKAKVDVWPVVLIPLFLASFASSPLPVSNLTNLIVASSLHISALTFLAHMGLATVCAVAVGWLAYRRRFYRKVTLAADAGDLALDRRALVIGSIVVLLVLFGFIVGPLLGLEAWMVALMADIVLVVITKHFSWRYIPLLPTLGVFALVVIVTAAIYLLAIPSILPQSPNPVQLVSTAALATAVANTVNNLSGATYVAYHAPSVGWGLWAWVVGINVGAVLLPIGAVANLLWCSILRKAGVRLEWRRYVADTPHVALPALGAAIIGLLLTRTLL